MLPIKERVLCVVDDEEDRRSLINTLSNFEATSATTLEEALMLARSKQFDLYLFKKFLPNGTGVDLCLRIREFDPHTPILFLTDSASENDLRCANQAEAQGFFVRNGSLEGLAEAVLRLVKSEDEGDDDGALLM